MPLKPERSYPNLSTEEAQVANSIASHIETQINKFSTNEYGNQYKLNRFTEMHWHVYPKYDSSKLLHVAIENKPNEFPATNGFFTLVVFYKPIPSEEKMKTFCSELRNVTGYPVRCEYTLDSLKLFYVK